MYLWEELSLGPSSSAIFSANLSYELFRAPAHTFLWWKELPINLDVNSSVWHYLYFTKKQYFTVLFCVFTRGILEESVCGVVVAVTAKLES